MKRQKIIEIKYRDYSAKINLSRGGNCISLRNQKYGAKLLREPDYSKELDNPYLYGMPIVFPANRILGGKFTFEDREYIFPINEPVTGCHLHGELHKTEFQLVEKSENRIVCLYRADRDNPYLMFPHEFEIKIEYELNENGLTQKTEVTNLSDKNMPVFLGFHTTFHALFTEGSRAEDMKVLVEIAEEYERNMANYLPTGNKPVFDDITTKLDTGEFSPFEEPISRHYRCGRDGKMMIYDAGKKLSMVYENDEKFKFRLINNGNADEYILLEPQTCLANCQNSPFTREEAGFDYIEPGKSKKYISKIYIVEGEQR